MITREMRPAFRSRDVRPQLAHLSRLVPTGSSARPFVLIPTLRYPHFKVLSDAGENFFCLFKHIADSHVLLHRCDLPRSSASHVTLKDAALARLIRRHIVYIGNWEVRSAKAAQAFRDPKPFARLQQDSRG